MEEPPPSPQASTIYLSPMCDFQTRPSLPLNRLRQRRRPSATVKLIGKFIGSSPKSIALNTLSHLLSPDTSHPHLTSLALPLYSKIKETYWFESNPKLVAAMAAWLDKQGRHSESETLISETISELGNRERDLALSTATWLNHIQNKTQTMVLRGPTLA
ncbi:hypothetical protein FNV43_RR13296 [Rhamnella rubrinervis]|uniref:Uncharacterized protein n=1 Tax=Rhamnella rubrinervis TaxID=2594499 RepID=A0A8K0H0Z6_9ROSA|nr:hypothetical protein FNV43_RR13296 [Rhamnella rubrinervis]